MYALPCDGVFYPTTTFDYAMYGWGLVVQAPGYDANDLCCIACEGGELYSSIDIIERFGKSPWNASTRDKSPDGRWAARIFRHGDQVDVLIRRLHGGGGVCIRNVSRESLFMFTSCSRYFVVSRQMEHRVPNRYARPILYYRYEASDTHPYRRYEVYDLLGPTCEALLAALRKKEWTKFFVEVDGDHAVWSRVLAFS